MDRQHVRCMVAAVFSPVVAMVCQWAFNGRAGGYVVTFALACAPLVYSLQQYRRHLEGQVSESQRQLIEKDRMVTLLVHELKSPVAAIANAIYLLRMRGGDGPPFAIAEQSLIQMSALLNDLTDVSRITRGKVQLRYQPFDLREVLELLTPALMTEAGKKGIKFEVLAPEQVTVFGDPVRVNQILVNLMQNAVKFTDHGEVNVTLTRGSHAACFIVEDTGIGIAPEVLPVICEPFRQADMHDSRGGLGLGLSLVKGLVDLHGGILHVYSAGLGKGATFTVELPLEEGLLAKGDADAHLPTGRLV